MDRRPTHTPEGRRWLGSAMLGVALLAAQLPWAHAQPAGPNVPVAEVTRRPVGQALTLDGTVEAVQQATLAAQASGRIVQLHVKAGERVRAGQVLAVIDDRETTAGVQRASGAVAQAEAEARNAEAHAKRTRELRTQGFVSQAALDSAEAQAAAARAALQQAKAAQSQAALAQGYTRLTAPFDGLVLATHAEVGDLAAPGRPVVTVYAPQPLRATVHVPASQAALADRAQRVEVRLPDGRWVAPAQRNRLAAADPVAQTIEWRLPLAATDAQGVLPGQAVKVRFVAGSDERLVVPARAVLRRGELTAVYVVAPAGSSAPFVLRAVRTGAEHGDDGVEIVSGLQPGERVALDPVRAGLRGAQPAQ
ncbi:MAG: efflux RND transporter periplasmic adaptor subunit [Tepidimonas ignava]|uniref:Efflux pump periplasmic linker BepF n=1 Tax=Tepidimonas ignava TaxID=114249 RepID=A0A4R3LG14_9BURK|nr:efflux RND transporter periplasmic adaptor subunit [Tepidimonas ignava]MCX7815862.1 efflux RND transporter periplasmic adaptor subunit [Tepidimonas ignava]TCS98398.1 RND family efflux transporter MFP subunit [Tepidimonas ignava]TSE19560.1 Efflux pump periplasmic linker BepF [Tepidimonas ignava]